MKVGFLLVSACALVVPGHSMHSQTGTSLSGIVWDSARAAPVAGAAVTLPDLGKATQTDSTGRFWLGTMPAGRYTLAIRRMGYGALDTSVTVSGESVAIIRVAATPQQLGEVNVRAAGVGLDRMAGFETRRAQGQGRFLTREDLAKAGDRQLTEVVLKLGSSLRIIRNQSEAYLVTVLQQASGALRQGCDLPIAIEQTNNLKKPLPAYALECGRLRGCLVQIYIDGVKVFGQGPERNETPPNLDELLIRNIEAIEFYSSPSRTPAEFQTMTAQCGTLVIWTRAH